MGAKDDVLLCRLAAKEGYPGQVTGNTLLRHFTTTYNYPKPSLSYTMAPTAREDLLKQAITASITTTQKKERKKGPHVPRIYGRHHHRQRHTSRTCAPARLVLATLASYNI